MDKSRKMLSDKEAYYLLNHEQFVNVNGKNNGSMLGKSTPRFANYPACVISQPQGENYTAGVYRSPITNELYSFHINTHHVDYILRISNDGCEVVYYGCLQLSADPRHSIEQFRVYLKVDKTCKNQHGKQLIWTIGQGNIGQIDVEASIATNFFHTPFFDSPCYDECELVQMCVPQICGCIVAEYMPFTQADVTLKNELLDTGFKFMFRYIYYDERASEWSDRSSLYFQDTKGCFDTSSGFSRCIKLRIPIGNPLVEKIEIAYTIDNGATWLSYEVIDKYKPYNSSQQYWYERQLSETISGSGYSDTDCSFDYIFCNDKQCNPVDPTLVDRVFNPIPRDAQGLIPIKEALGFYNYIQGTCPIDKHQIEKIDIVPDCSSNPNCATEYADVKIRLIIHNFENSKNQFIYRLGAGSQDDPGDMARFGGLNDTGIFGGGGGFDVGYDQNFDGETRNFIVYIEGTEIWAEMKQFRSSPNWPVGGRKLNGIVNNFGDKDVRNSMDDFTDDGGFFYQEATLKVKKGVKGFLRVASHHAQSGVGSNQDTSTFTVGTFNLFQYRGDKNNVDGLMEKKHEIYFTTCNGSVDLNEAFVIQDNAEDEAVKTKAASAFGYIKDENGDAVPGARIRLFVPTGTPARGLVTLGETDHNGFYHFTVFPGGEFTTTAEILVEKDCTSGNPNTNFKIAKTFSLSMKDGEATESNQVITKDDFLEYKNNFYAKVQFRVVDCRNVGVAGIRVALSGAKYAVTKSNGIAEFKIRNYSHRARQLRAVVIDHKNCLSFDCNEQCNPCLPESSAVAPTCFINIPVVNMPTVVVNKDAAFTDRQGLKNGGRYAWAVVVEGACGRISSPYEIKYMNIPRAQEVGDVTYCGYKYDATKRGKMILPEWGTCLKILRSKNLNPFELQWSVDKIERISGSKIKLTIQSLNDYNASYNFKTNTVYQYLKGDRIEFIRNGDGKVFDTNIHGVLNYQTLSPFHDQIISGQKEAEADYFNQLLIEDDGKLESLKEGAVIEMQRPSECTTAPAYYEICASIPIINGELFHDNGTFKTFDTYLVNRQIGTLSQSFEHHSPSDFWAQRMDDTGKGHIVNKYENEKRFGRNISLNAPNQYNYFGSRVKTFDAPEQGDITAMGISDGKVILAIGEHDNFLAQVSDDLVRVGGDSTIRASPPDSIISDSQPKLSGKYGCQYPHIGSVYFGDGYVTWADGNAHDYIIHDYSSAKSAAYGKVQSYFRRRFQEIEAHNRKTADLFDHYRFATGMSMDSGMIHLTIKTFRNSGINNERAAYMKPNETILYHPKADDWFGFTSPTPEAYGHIDLFDGGGCALITYLNGQPYIHPLVYDKWNEYYGVAVDRVIGISLNQFKNKKKSAISIEIQDESMWFVSEVTTDSDGFLSEIPPVRWKQNKGKWNASFLNNKNSRGGLYGNKEGIAGESTQGYVINCTFVRDNTDQLKYATIDNTKRVKYDELDEIIFKFAVVESSGYTENL